jgi:hypothetical protein
MRIMRIVDWGGACSQAGFAIEGGLTACIMVHVDVGELF